MSAAVGAALLCGVALLVSSGGQVRGPAEAPATPHRRNTGATLSRTVSGWWSRRGHPDSHDDVVPLMDALASALRAGLSTPDALRMTAGAADPGGLLTPLVRAADEGRPLGHEWRRLAQRVDHPDLSALARAWMLSERGGCPVADAVATSATTARARTALSHRLDAATAGARATCTMLTVLPLGGLVLASLLGLPPTALYGHPTAVAAGLLGLLLLLLGRWTVQRMITRVTAAVC